MKNRKAIIIFAILAALLLMGTTTGVVMALDQQQSEKGSPAKIFFERVGEILGIPADKVEAAFKQAAKELRDQKFEAYINGLVEKGKITKEQAEHYKNWLKSKPDFELPRMGKAPGYWTKMLPFR